MTLRTFVDKHGNDWNWEETPEVKEALRKLHSGNCEVPLYAPRPELKNGKETN